MLNVQIRFRTKGRQHCRFKEPNPAQSQCKDENDPVPLAGHKVEKPLPSHPILFQRRFPNSRSQRFSRLHNGHNRLSVTSCPGLPTVAPATAHPFHFYSISTARQSPENALFRDRNNTRTPARSDTTCGCPVVKEYIDTGHIKIVSIRLYLPAAYPERRPPACTSVECRRMAK